MVAILAAFAAPVANGQLDKDKVRGVIFKHLKKVKQCYEQLLKTGSNEEGKIVLDFEIQSNGSVKSAKVDEAKSTLESEIVRRCLVNEAKTWKFDAFNSKEIVAVNYPFLFSKDAPQFK